MKKPIHPSTTIAAIATPPGDGGVSIIRLSGPDAVEIASIVSKKEVSQLESHKLYYATIYDENHQGIDQGLLVYMKSPKSFTGEDVVEFQGHGGHYITQKVLRRFYEAGAKSAAPGEFTQRAFLNGKCDLAQAEAIQSLIAAKNDYALKCAQKQLEGSLSKKIKKLQNQLIEEAAILEAWVDFPEEGLEFTSFEALLESLENTFKEMERLEKTYRHAQTLERGFSLCLVGKPNVGKSSLMNALLKRNRALVTSIAGTTRDTLEETLNVNGMTYRLIDTAGIRQTEELVEKLGIERAKQMSHEADCVLLVLDASKPLEKEDYELIEHYQKHPNVCLLWNKMDLKPFDENPKISIKNQLQVSAQKDQGIDSIYELLPKLLLKDLPVQDEIMLTQERHFLALKEAKELLQKVIIDLKGDTSAEWVTFDLKMCLKKLGEIIGFDLTESLLGNIFSRFCIGK